MAQVSGSSHTLCPHNLPVRKSASSNLAVVILSIFWGGGEALVLFSCWGGSEGGGCWVGFGFFGWGELWVGRDGGVEGRWGNGGLV